jgi:hypothetical protein
MRLRLSVRPSVRRLIKCLKPPVAFASFIKTRLLRLLVFLRGKAITGGGVAKSDSLDHLDHLTSR